jgi:YVTN family beta-propeller protein
MQAVTRHHRTTREANNPGIPMVRSLCSFAATLALLATSALATPLALVTHETEDALSLIDALDYSVVAEVPITREPTGIAIHPDGRFAFVVTESGFDASCEGNIVLVDIEAASIIECLRGGEDRRLTDVVISPSGRDVYVLRSNAQDVLRIAFDPSRPEEVQFAERIPLDTMIGSPRRLIVHPDGTRLYVSIAIDNEIQEVGICRPSCSEVVASYPVATRPTGLALSPFGETLYVASRTAGQVTALDTLSAEQTVLDITADAGPKAIAVHPRGHEIYVANEDNNTVTFLDISNPLMPTVSAVVPVDGSPVDIAIHPWADRLAVALGDSTDLQVIDIASRSVLTAPLDRRQSRVGFASFPTTDQVISSPASNLIDPEFDTRNNRLVWQDLKLNGSAMWLADIDPDTADISPRSGKGTLIDDEVAPVLSTLNGPEWSFGPDSTFIVYTDLNEEGRDQVAFAWQDDNTLEWTTQRLVNGEDRFSPLGSGPENAVSAYVAYVAQAEFGKAIVYRDLDNAPDIEVFASTARSAPFWAEDRPAFVFTSAGATALQISLYDIPSDTVTELTSDPENKYLPSTWWAPDFGEYLMMCMVGNQRIGIYRDAGTHWEQINLITLPSIYRFVHSPEPFVHQGRSYLSVVAAEQLGDGTQEIASPSGNTEIWIAGVDSAQPFLRRVSRASRSANRRDPEPFSTTAGVVVLFTEKDPQSEKFLLRRAQTGLLN